MGHLLLELLIDGPATTVKQKGVLSLHTNGQWKSTMTQKKNPSFVIESTSQTQSKAKSKYRVLG